MRPKRHSFRWRRKEPVEFWWPGEIGWAVDYAAGPPFRDAWMDGFSLLAGHSTWMEKVGEGCRGGRLRGTLNHRKSANLPSPVHLLVTAC
jgi:hypothetical protein